MRTISALALLALVSGMFLIESSTAQGIQITPALVNRIAADCKDQKSTKCTGWINIGKNLCLSDTKGCPAKLDQACKGNLKVCQALAPGFCKVLTGTLKGSCNKVAAKYIKGYKPM